MMPNSSTRTTISSGSGKYSCGADDVDDADDAALVMFALVANNECKVLSVST